MSTRMTQHNRIIDYMQKKGFITSMDAYRYLGITQLATRIKELKEDKGYNIGGTMYYGTNGNGEPFKFKAYYLYEGTEETNGNN